jgi:hypothetical protein
LLAESVSFEDATAETQKFLNTLLPRAHAKATRSYGLFIAPGTSFPFLFATTIIESPELFLKTLIQRHETVKKISERFATLNPYEFQGTILKIKTLTSRTTTRKSRSVRSTGTG